MNEIKILLPYDGIDEEEIKKAVNSVEGCSVNFDEQSNGTGELVCAILTLAINAKMLLVALDSLKEAKLANKRVDVVDSDGTTIKANVRLKKLLDLFPDLFNND